MLFRTIFPEVPERVQKTRQRAGRMSETGNQNGRDDGKLSHVTLL